MVTEQMIKIVADRLKDKVQKIKTHLTNLESDIDDLEKLSSLCQIENKEQQNKNPTTEELVGLKEGVEKILGITLHKSHEEKNIEKILASASANGTKVIGVPPGGGMVIGVGSDMEVSMHPVDAFPKVNNAPKVHNFYNDDVKAKRGGRIISNKFNKEVHDLDADELYEDRKFTQVLKDIQKIDFDLENIVTSCNEEYKGYAYQAVQAGGDWEYPVWFFVYHDGTNFRGYVPIRGNAVNTINKSAFGNDGTSWAGGPDHGDDEKFLSQYHSGNKPDDAYVNYEECKKDFECRVGLREVDANGIPKD